MQQNANESSNNEIKNYCIREYSYKGVFDRHRFVNIYEDTVKQDDEELYASYFLHTEEIIEYYKTHKNEEGKNTLEGYRGSVYSPDFKIDIDEKETALDKVRLLLKHWESVYELDLK